MIDFMKKDEMVNFKKEYLLIPSAIRSRLSKNGTNNLSAFSFQNITIYSVNVIDLLLTIYYCLSASTLAFYLDVFLDRYSLKDIFLDYFSKLN